MISSSTTSFEKVDGKPKSGGAPLILFLPANSPVSVCTDVKQVAENPLHSHCSAAKQSRLNKIENFEIASSLPLLAMTLTEFFSELLVIGR